MITDPAMKTVYAITLDANKREEFEIETQKSEMSVRLDRLYAVSGGNGRGEALGFTFSVRPEDFGELLSTWKPDQVRSLLLLLRSPCVSL